MKQTSINGLMSIGFSVLISLPFTVVPAHAQHNALTAAEQAAGYTSLFNGTDLTGWRSYGTTTAPSGWSVVAESTWKAIQLITSIGQAGSLVTSDATLQNFDLKIEWNVPSAGNSGIFTRYDGIKSGTINNSWGGCCGPESQVVAINNNDGTSLLHQAGVCYDMFPLDASAANWSMKSINGQNVNYGFYQQFRVVAYDRHVAHFGNGVKLLEYVIGSPEWKTAYNASKYKAETHYGDIHPGAIYLQDHGETGIKYRDIRIKKLTKSPWAVGSVYLANPNDTTKLKNLTFADNLFPPDVGISSLKNSMGLSAQVSNLTDGVAIQLSRPGEFDIRVHELSGRILSSRSVHNTDRAIIPAANIHGTCIVSVWEKGVKKYQGIFGKL